VLPTFIQWTKKKGMWKFIPHVSEIIFRGMIL
jgi:hypothetical protein